jgi:hypothetical protein
LVLEKIKATKKAERPQFFLAKYRKVVGAGDWVLGAGYWMLDTGYWMLDAGYWILDARYLFSNLELDSNLVAQTIYS